MPNHTAIKMAETMIKADLITLNDLPRELANTIANVHYKFALGFLELDHMRQSESVHRSFDDFKASITANVESVSDTGMACDMVRSLREMDKIKDPNLYQYSVEFILDLLKYKIDNAEHKTGIRRIIERKFKIPDEIPNLIDLMNFRENAPQELEKYGNKVNTAPNQSDKDKSHGDEDHSMSSVKGQQLAKECSQTNQEDIVDHFKLGNSALADNRLETAIEEFREALKSKKDFAEAYNNLGLALFYQSRFDDAEVEFRNALRIEPNFSLAHANLGLALLNNNLIKESIEELVRAVALNPEIAEAYYNLGIAYTKSGLRAEAVNAYEGFVRHAGENYRNYVEGVKQNISNLKAQQ